MRLRSRSRLKDWLWPVLIIGLVAVGLAVLSDWPIPGAELHLVHIRGPNEQFIELNINEISSIRKPRANEEHFAKGTRCLIFTTDGKFISALDTCEQIIEGIKKAE